MQISRPWVGNYLGDCGPYDGAQWSERLGARDVDSEQPDSGGVIAGSFTELQVEPMVPPALAVVVRRGSAFVCDRWYHNSTPLILPIAVNTSGLTRYDWIVLRKRWPEGTIRAVVLTGSPGNDYLTLTQSYGLQWEILLAVVEVASGVAAINAADITDEREFVNPRRIQLGLGDFETDLAVNPATISLLPGTDTRGWELTTGANDEIFTSMIVPTEWGDNILRFCGYVWGHADVSRFLPVQQRVYASGDPAGMLVVFGNAHFPGGNEQPITRAAVMAGGAIIDFPVSPGDLIEIQLANMLTVNNVWILGMELHFRRQ